MAPDAQATSHYLKAASDLKASIIRVFWNENSGVLRFNNSTLADGICQDTNAYGTLMGLLPEHPNGVSLLCPDEELLPPAFKGLGQWDTFGISSPYASGFALDALFTKGEHVKALELLHQIWGIMADESNPNYSGAHWEAMDRHGNPFNHDVSMAHGWSTWPVFLMPKYLAGLHPLEPGWRKVAVQPVLARLEKVSYSIETVSGMIGIVIFMGDNYDEGSIKLTLPVGITGVVSLPAPWSLSGPGEIEGIGKEVVMQFSKG